MHALDAPPDQYLLSCMHLLPQSRRSNLLHAFVSSSSEIVHHRFRLPHGTRLRPATDRTLEPLRYFAAARCAIEGPFKEPRIHHRLKTCFDRYSSDLGCRDSAACRACPGRGRGGARNAQPCSRGNYMESALQLRGHPWRRLQLFNILL